MTTRDIIQKMFNHLRWADERVLSSLKSATPPFERAERLYNHIINAEATWLSRIHGQGDYWDQLSLSECESRAKEVHGKYIKYLSELDDKELERFVHYKNKQGQPYETRVCDILLQVATHGAYHRGQISMLLRDGGAEPVATDYIVFVREA